VGASEGDTALRLRPGRFLVTTNGDTSLVDWSDDGVFCSEGFVTCSEIGDTWKGDLKYGLVVVVGVEVLFLSNVNWAGVERALP
jgi:hypothetical protein